MKTIKLIILASLLAFLTVTLAHAGAQVKLNQAAVVKAAVKNTTNRSVRAAVKLTGYDDAGSKVGQLCKEAWLGEGRTTSVEYAWNAPGYATGIYWQAKVEVEGNCPYTEVSTYDFHDYDHDDHEDDEHDDGSEDDHH